MIPKRLYHYTSEFHYDELIAPAGFLKLTASNVHPTALQPEVVWFLDRPLQESDQGGLCHGLTGAMFDKTEIEIIVDIPAKYGIAHRWLDWAKTQPGYDEIFVAIMVEAGGGIELAKHWWVVTHAVPSQLWHVVNRRYANST